MTSVALIPARGGSKGISRKNIKTFNSKPLIYWSIKAALRSNYIDRVIVSTEDKEIAEIAKSYKAECTPDFYLFDKNLMLVYRGRYDDSRPGNNLSCDGNDLNYAIDCLIQNKVNDKLQKPSIGCNIKWKLS